MINQDISSCVPKIEQDRLFYITTLLYYGLREIHTLEQNGFMPTALSGEFGILRIKTKSESDGSVGGWCRKFLSAVWIAAVGEPTPAGEVVASVATLIVGGVLLYEYIVCKKDSTNSDTYQMCQNKYEDCTDYTPKYDCGTCLSNCMVQGSWPYWICP